MCFSRVKCNIKQMEMDINIQSESENETMNQPHNLILHNLIKRQSIFTNVKLKYNVVARKIQVTMIF